MKRLQQSGMMKFIVGFLISAGICAMTYSGAELLHIYNALRSDFTSIFYNTPYEQTALFQHEYNEKMEQLAEYLKIKNILEENGILDYNKEIASVLDKDGNETVYTLGEILKINGNSSVFPTVVDDGHVILLDRIYNGLSMHLIGIGSKSSIPESLSIPRDSIDVVIDDSDIHGIQELDRNKLWEQMGFFIDFTNAGDIYFFENIEDAKQYYSILRETETNPIMKVILLEDVVYRIQYYMEYYQYYQTILQNSNTRFAYWISYGDQIETNLSQEQLGETPQVSFSGVYFSNIVYSSERFIATEQDTYGLREVMYVLDRLNHGTQDNLQIHFAINADTSIADIFTTEQLNYEWAKKYGASILITLSVSILVICFGTIYLLYASGHKKGVEGIALNLFDRLYTEVTLFITIGIWVAVFVFLYDIQYTLMYEIYDSLTFYEDSYRLVYMVGIGGAIYVIYWLEMLGLCSVFRKLKAKVFLKSSLSYRLCARIKRIFNQLGHMIHYLYDNRSISVKVMIVYGAIWVLIEIIILAAIVSYGEFWIFLVGSPLLMVLFAIIIRNRILFMTKYHEILYGAERIAGGDMNYKLDVVRYKNEQQRMALAINNISSGLAKAVDQSIRDERMKTDLITNVSHDIKTPLTSIINYVDLLKREDIEDEKIRSYIEVLEVKSQRLKNLTDDLVEASKLSSGNVVLTIDRLDLVELVNQTNGEFAEKFENRHLTIMPSMPAGALMIEVDGKRLWRVLENLYNNVAKYAMEHTRVYIQVDKQNGTACFTIRNISENPLQMDALELSERFIRGDVSRSSEGSGLGLSIAKSITEMMQGTFEVYLEGDLFRVMITFPLKEEVIEEVVFEKEEEGKLMV